MTAFTENEFANPLDKYRSYSYQFILTAASTTEAFRKMMGAADGKVPVLDQVAGKLPGEAFSVGGDTAYLVLDSRRHSAYQITELDMEHAYGTGDRSNPTVPVNLTRMKLIDTTGLTFFNFMMDLFQNKLESTRASAFFLLTIIFVGHTNENTTETVSTCFIPLMLLLMDMEFSTAGSVYHLDFMEVEGGPKRGAQMTQLNNLGAVQSITTKEVQSKTLEGMLMALEDQLNIKSLEFYQKYTNAAAKSAGKTRQELKLGKLVQYMITLPDEWKSFTVDAAQRAKYQESEFIARVPAGNKDVKTGESPKQSVEIAGDYSQITFSHGATTITDAIKAILETSEKIVNLATIEKRTKGEAVGFKIVPSVTADNATYLVHFDIYPYRLPKPTPPAATPNTTNVSIGTAKTGAIKSGPVEAKNILNFRYLFTGKNSHITDLKVHYLPESAVALDTNLDLGRSRTHSNAATASTKTSLTPNGDGEKQTVNPTPYIRRGDPIFFPMVSKDQQNNASGVYMEHRDHGTAVDFLKKKQEFSETMAMVHFISNIDLEMTIRGNPDLLRKHADRQERNGIPPHGTIASIDDLNRMEGETEETAKKNYSGDAGLKSKLKSAKDQYVKAYTQPRIDSINAKLSDGKLSKTDITQQPLLVKLDIRAPNVNFDGTMKNGEPMFTDKFFFDGPYMVLFIKTTFHAGEFKQQLSLIPYDLDGSYTNSGSANKNTVSTGMEPGKTPRGDN